MHQWAHTSTCAPPPCKNKITPGTSITTNTQLDSHVPQPLTHSAYVIFTALQSALWSGPSKSSTNQSCLHGSVVLALLSIMNHSCFLVVPTPKQQALQISFDPPCHAQCLMAGPSTTMAQQNAKLHRRSSSSHEPSPEKTKWHQPYGMPTYLLAMCAHKTKQMHAYTRLSIIRIIKAMHTYTWILCCLRPLSFAIAAWQ